LLWFDFGIQLVPNPTICRAFDVTAEASVNCLCRSIKRKPLLTPAITESDENLIASSQGGCKLVELPSTFICVLANERRAQIHSVGSLQPLLLRTEKPFVFARPLRAYIRNNSAAHSNSRIHLLRSSESRLLLGLWL
jgi:hypothetical protein